MSGWEADRDTPFDDVALSRFLAMLLRMTTMKKMAFVAKGGMEMPQPLQEGAPVYSSSSNNSSSSSSVMMATRTPPYVS